ncbi:MAG: DUF167 domain-containing protein [Acidobacteria bacterium]|nr:DUF167 domain-containing protein [Acidobacteriota bacterium]
MTLQVQSRGGAVRFHVKVQPRARREGIAGLAAGVLRVRVTAPPVEGRANRALIELLAEHLRLPKSSIKIAAGERRSLKLVEVAGIDAATVLERLRLAAARYSRRD